MPRFYFIFTRTSYRYRAKATSLQVNFILKFFGAFDERKNPNFVVFLGFGYPVTMCWLFVTCFSVTFGPACWFFGTSFHFFFEALGVLVIYHPNTFSRSIPSDFFTGTVSYGRPNV